jgi:DNA-binding response OmpR family regulator
VNSNHLVLTVDRNQRNLELLAQFLNKEGYETIQATSVEALDKIVSNADGIGLALVDISGFDHSIWKCCEQLQAKGIPLLVLSPRQSVAIQQESFAHGARGVLIKPLVIKELLGLIKSLTEE